MPQNGKRERYCKVSTSIPDKCQKCLRKHKVILCPMVCDLWKSKTNAINETLNVIAHDKQENPYTQCKTCKHAPMRFGIEKPCYYCEAPRFKGFEEVASTNMDEARELIAKAEGGQK